MIGGSLDFDLVFLRDAPGYLAKCRGTPILPGAGQVNVLKGEGFGNTRWLETGPNAPSGCRGLGLG